MSWVEEQERILSIEHTLHREPMKFIKCYFFYINMNDYIDKIDMEELDIGDIEGGILDSGTVLKIIQSKKVYTVNSKYIFKDLFMYHIDLEPDQIQGFVDFSGDLTEFSSRFFRKLSVVDDIVILPSIEVFHSVNGLYFFFHETFLKKAREPKSILKSGDGSSIVGHTRKKHSIGMKTTRKVGWKTI